MLNMLSRTATQSVKLRETFGALLRNKKNEFKNDLVVGGGSILYVNPREIRHRISLKTTKTHTRYNLHGVSLTAHFQQSSSGGRIKKKNM